MSFSTNESALIEMKNLQTNAISASRRLLRSVKFDFGQISPTSFGNFQHRGQFTQLRSRFERPTITNVELESMKNYLSDWINQFFQTDLRQKYYAELVETICVSVYYMYPFPSVMSMRMKLALPMTAFFWLLDDVVEPCLISREIITHEALKVELDSLLKILENNDTRRVVLPEACRLFAELRHYVIAIKKLLQQNDHYVNLDGFCAALGNTFEKYLTYANAPLDESDSEEAFCSWRKTVACCDGAAEFLWSLENKMPLTSKISKSTSFQRLLDLGKGIGAFTNDLLGLKHELRNDRIDNWILFKVFQKKIPIELAVEQVCQSLDNDMTSYLALVQEILVEFSYDPNLVKYIDILDAVIFEQIYLYEYAQRYQATGQLILTNL